MNRVLLSESAEGDLAEIWFSIATGSIDTADQLMDSLQAVMRKLAEQPLMGRARPDLAPDIRSFVHGKFVIFYKAMAQGVGVSRVIHGARDQRQIGLPPVEE